MKVAFISDLHIANHRKFNNVDFQLLHKWAGVNNRCTLSLDVLSRAFARAKDKGCSSVCILGDLFDGVRPEPQVLAATMTVLSAHASEHFGIHIMPGNHDQVEPESKNNTLGPISFLPHVKVHHIAGTYLLVGSKVVQIEIWNVPFRPGNVSEWLPKVLEDLSGQASQGVLRFLTLHAGISECAMPMWQRALPDAISTDTLVGLCEGHDLSAVFAGHWHARRLWEVKRYGLVQLGAMCPADWRDTAYGVMAILEVEKLDGKYTIETEVIPGPRFVECDSQDESLNCLKQFDRSCHVFARMVGTEKNGGMQGVRVRLEELRVQGVIAGYEVLPDDRAALVAGRTAATLARSADTLEKALSEFVSKMPLEEGVDRSRVLELSRSFLES